MKNLKELREDGHKAIAAMQAISDKAKAEKRNLNADEQAQVAEQKSFYDAAVAAIKEAEASENLMDMIGNLEGVGALAGVNEKRGRKGTAGQNFVESKQWRDFMAQNGGHIPDSRRGINLPSVDAPELGRKLFTGGDVTSAGAFVLPEDTGLVEMEGRHPYAVRGLVSVRTTLSDAVEFVRQTLQFDAAEPVPEANVAVPTGATGEIDGQKPYASGSFERVSEAVRVIAVWTAATKRALSDAGQVRGIIDQELRGDLADQLEYQLLHGDGSGENLRGISNTPGVLVQPFVTDMIQTTRKAITRLRVYGKQLPTAFVMNPEDWEAFDLMQDAEDRYYWGGPTSQGSPTLWGVPVVQSFHLAPGTAYLANWSKAVIWDRQQTTITVTDSHSDFFTRNLVAFLAEMRLAFGVIRPSAFVEIDLGAGS